MRFFDEGLWWLTSACHLRMRYDRDHFQIILKEHPLPKRWRPRDNDNVRLLCIKDARHLVDFNCAFYFHQSP